MRTNLIQSYIQDNQNLQQYRADNAKKNFDVNKELANRTFIKPLPSNGHLVRNSLFDMPSEFFKDVKYDTKAFTHALKGKANDHELGTLNDLGMKLGGLSIATYLFSRKSTPITKVMEFVGFASFFAAMDIWPKLALQLPAYLIHGFNIRQNYRDNYGTKKPVFQDHQFIPWDLYSDAEINKIGDRMRVPKNMKNRRDFIQEKMRKIALQNNTMWMLTSGFATPIMSALICNALEKPIASWQDKRTNKKAENLLNNFDAEVKKVDFSQEVKDLNTLLDGSKDKNITSELFKSIVGKMSPGLDAITSKALKKDLKNILLPDEYDISVKTFEDISNIAKAAFEGVPESDLQQIIPNAQEIIENLPERMKTPLKNSTTIHNVKAKDFAHFLRAFNKAISSKVMNFAEKNPANENLEKISVYATGVQSDAPKFKEVFTKVRTAVLDENKIKKLKEINNILNTYVAKRDVLWNYAYLKSAQAPETYLANTWNQVMSDDLIKVLGITEKDIKNTRMDSKLVGDMLRKKIEGVVSDDTKYNAVMDKLVEKLNFLEDRTQFAADLKKTGSDISTYRLLVNKAFDTAAGDLWKRDMRYTVNRLTGYGRGESTNLKSLQLKFMEDRALGVKNSFYRLLNTLDFFKRTYEGEHLDSINNYVYKDEHGNVLQTKQVTKEVKEEIVEMVKQLLIGGHSSDYETKFTFMRNPNLNPSFDPNVNPDAKADEARMKDFSNIELKKDKKYDYLGKTPKQELAECPHDYKFYEAAMRVMYGDSLSDKTNAKIANSKFSSNFEGYRKEMLSDLGGFEYRYKPLHQIGSKNTTTEHRFNILGSALDDMFSKFLSTKYNSKTWLKIFGGLGAALLGITVISQFFMGYIHSDKVPKENKK